MATSNTSNKNPKQSTREAAPPPPPPSEPPPPAETTAIVPVEDAPLAEFDDYGDDANKGYENQDQDDRKIPMLVLLQGQSPMVAKGEARAGQILNSVSGEVYDAVDVVPVITDHVFVEYVTRGPKGESRGGFRGRHAKNAAIVARVKKLNGDRVVGKMPFDPTDKDGKPLLDKEGKQELTRELVETFEVAAVCYQAWRDGKPVFDGKQAEFPCLIPFQSAKIRHYREWNTAIGMYQRRIKVGDQLRKVSVPLFAHRARVTGALEEKNGQRYQVLKMSPVFPSAGDASAMDRSLLSKNDERYVAASLLHDQFAKGRVRGAYETAEQDAPAERAAKDGGASGEEDVPF